MTIEVHLHEFFVENFLNKTNINIKQINLVKVRKCGTVKGFHLQTGKFKEDKYVVCIKGEIIDYYFKIKKKLKLIKKGYLIKR